MVIYAKIIHLLNTCSYRYYIINLFYHTTRISHCHTIRRNRTGNHTPRPDNTVPPDGDTRQNDNPSTNPYSILYSYR